MNYKRRETTISNLLYELKLGKTKIESVNLPKYEESKIVECALAGVPMVIYGEEAEGILYFRLDGYKMQAVLDFVCDQFTLNGIFRKDLKGVVYSSLSVPDYKSFMDTPVSVIIPDTFLEEK